MWRLWKPKEQTKPNATKDFETRRGLLRNTAVAIKTISDPKMRSEARGALKRDMRALIREEAPNEKEGAARVECYDRMLEATEEICASGNKLLTAFHKLDPEGIKKHANEIAVAADILARDGLPEPTRTQPVAPRIVRRDLH